MNEETLSDLVGDDALAAAEEEAVLETVVEWIKAGGDEEGCGGRLL